MLQATQNQGSAREGLQAMEGGFGLPSQRARAESFDREIDHQKRNGRVLPRPMGERSASRRQVRVQSAALAIPAAGGPRQRLLGGQAARRSRSFLCPRL